MNVYMYVCVCMYYLCIMCVCMCVYVCMYYVCMYICMYVCMYVFVCTLCRDARSVNNSDHEAPNSRIITSRMGTTVCRRKRS